MFAELWRSIPNPPWQERHRRAYISNETWSLINASIEEHQRGDQQSSWYLACAIKSDLQGDRRKQAAEVGSVV